MWCQKFNRIADKNIANPVAMILCVALMFRYSFGMEKEAKLIEEAIRQTLDSGIRTADLGGKSRTKEVGDAIVAYLQQRL
jgi:3-isopropylmalate dehydrogenase